MQGFIKKALVLALAAGAICASAQSLQLDPKSGLQWRDAQGGLIASLPLRAKRFDQRALPDGSRVAVVLEGEQLVLVRAAARELQVQARFPGPGFAVERLCLQRDAQGLLHLFLLGNEGLSAQWLLHDGQRLSERGLATPPHPVDCQVRDADGRLLIAETGVGLWSYAADAEDARRSLLLHAPDLDERQLRVRLLDEARREPPVAPTPVVVSPSAQTEPTRHRGDSADDPAIWVHPRQPQRSRILGTDKKGGLEVYDLQGRELQYLPVGRINNVDLRQRLRYGPALDLAVATQRDENSLVLFGIAADGKVSELARLPTPLNDIYGICVGRNAQGQLDIFPNDKDGRVLQLRLQRQGASWQVETVGGFKLESQPEGCVVDEARQQLFIGEEKRGVWRVDLAAGALKPELVIPVGGSLVADVEGMAVYGGNARDAKPYLLVSSQGSDSFVVYDAVAPFAQRGHFRIGLNAARGIDGVSETDGLDVSSANLGGVYGEGLLVVQDGHKRLPQGTQNFKLVPWAELRKAIGLGDR